MFYSSMFLNWKKVYCNGCILNVLKYMFLNRASNCIVVKSVLWITSISVSRACKSGIISSWQKPGQEYTILFWHPVFGFTHVIMNSMSYVYPSSSSARLDSLEPRHRSLSSARLWFFRLIPALVATQANKRWRWETNKHGDSDAFSEVEHKH